MPGKSKMKHSMVPYDGPIYCINGIQVAFPMKAYPSQITMMHKILQGLERRQNCLIESPTGSGKSLALLCSCLAWLKAENDRLKHLTSCVSEMEDESKSIIQFEESKKMPTAETQPLLEKRQRHSMMGKNEDGDDDDDFVGPTRKKPKTGQGKEARSVTQGCKATVSSSDASSCNPLVWRMESSKTNSANDDTANATSPVGGLDEKPAKARLPKVFFGTRTHKQIAQIVRELRKTKYKDVKMTILSSREHTCIHPSVSKRKDKNEECKKLIKGEEGAVCSFYSNAQTLAQPAKKAKYGLGTAWDIEDLVVAGRKAKACPYFAAREMMCSAEVVFCPYNYLVDPMIREQMGIHIKDQIVILDEAHNIEDSAREAGSATITGTQLEEACEDLDLMIKANIMVEAHKTMRLLCVSLLQWMESVKDQLKKRAFEEEAKVWTGPEMVQMLSLNPLYLTPTALSLYKDQLTKLIAADEVLNEKIRGGGEMRLNAKVLGFLRGLIFVLEKLLSPEKAFALDYRVALCRTAAISEKTSESSNGWLRKRRVSEKTWTYKLNLWCLNPAVVFSEIGSVARCIVLSSGTLSPMQSFSSELGVEFPITLEANHVIADNQVWVGALSVGPSNNPVVANYQNSETFAFQDDVGKIVLQVCQTIPKGVLCFLPSYSMLEKLSKRWQNTGLWSQISACKHVMAEPRSSEKSEFDDILTYFYECVRPERAAGRSRSPTGALLLAVCRGKVSEGLDFSDDNARAVITVGIPFPNVKDVQVELKRKYNNEHAASKGLLNGNEWYEIQAFRALNQALGRCIRHRSDWGALLMVDERFGRHQKYRNGLSKWIRSRVQVFADFQVCLSSMREFSEDRQNTAQPSVATLTAAVDDVSDSCHSDGFRNHAGALFEATVAVARDKVSRNKVLIDSLRTTSVACSTPQTKLDVSPARHVSSPGSGDGDLRFKLHRVACEKEIDKLPVLAIDNSDHPLPCAGNVHEDVVEDNMDLDALFTPAAQEIVEKEEHVDEDPFAPSVQNVLLYPSVSKSPTSKLNSSTIFGRAVSTPRVCKPRSKFVYPGAAASRSYSYSSGDVSLSPSVSSALRTSLVNEEVDQVSDSQFLESVDLTGLNDAPAAKGSPTEVCRSQSKICRTLLTDSTSLKLASTLPIVDDDSGDACIQLVDQMAAETACSHSPLLFPASSPPDVVHLEDENDLDTFRNDLRSRDTLPFQPCRPTSSIGTMSSAGRDMELSTRYTEARVTTSPFSRHELRNQPHREHPVLSKADSDVVNAFAQSVSHVFNRTNINGTSVSNGSISEVERVPEPPPRVPDICSKPRPGLSVKRSKRTLANRRRNIREGSPKVVHNGESFSGEEFLENIDEMATRQLCCKFCRSPVTRPGFYRMSSTKALCDPVKQWVSSENAASNSHLVYMVEWCSVRGAVDCQNAYLENYKTIGLNSFFDASQGKVYVPIFCEKCSNAGPPPCLRDAVIGAAIYSFNAHQKPAETVLFAKHLIVSTLGTDESLLAGR